MITDSFRLFDLEEHMLYGTNILHWKSYTPQIKKNQLIIYTVNRIKVDRVYEPPQTQRRAILPRCKTDLLAEWIDGNRILEHSFNHFQIKNFNVYLSLYCLMVLAEWIDGNRILEHSFDHYIFKLKFLMCTYQTTFEWWYVVQFLSGDFV